MPYVGIPVQIDPQREICDKCGEMLCREAFIITVWTNRPDAPVSRLHEKCAKEE
jgi:hypothetical protein